MKKFKLFLKEIEKKDIPMDVEDDSMKGFASSSASNGENIMDDDKNDEDEEIKESEIVHLPEQKSPLRDPKFHQGEHESVDVNKIGLTHHYTDSRTEPHLTSDQANKAKTLHDNTDTKHPSYAHAVNGYTHNSESLNFALFNDSKRAEQGGHSRLINHMDKAIAHHSLPENTTVYSGLHFHPLDSHNGKVHLPAYTSTSLSPHIAGKFGKAHRTVGENGETIINKHMMRLELPKGHNHLFSENQTHLPGEMEVVLPRNTKLKFGDKPSHIIKKPGLSGTVIHHHIWDAQLDK